MGDRRARPLTMGSIRAAATAVILGVPVVTLAHYDGGAQFTDGRDVLFRAFDAAHLSAHSCISAATALGPAHD